jgi:CubicO group peptidase (beta-lactamase class C family)
MRRVLCLAALIAAIHPLAAQQPPPSWAAATAAFDAYARADSTVGGALVLVGRDGPIAEHYHGFADRAAGIRAGSRTIWHWGSITKTLTAVGVMQLAERGKLRLDQPIVELVPEVSRIHNPFGSMSDVSIRQLLSHSSGLQAGTWPWSRGEAWEPFEPTEWAQLVAMMPYMKLNFAPGSRYSYSNPAVVYLARAIERLSGDTWFEYVRKNLFMPLALNESYFGNTPYHLAGARSHNYAVTTSGVIDQGADFDPGITIPNGGWNASITELSAWMVFLMGSADSALARHLGDILPRSTLESMWQPVVRVSAEEEMGLSFFLRRENGHKLVGHTGTQANFRSFFWLNPATRMAVIGVVNTSSDVDGARSTAGFNAMMAAARGVVSR